VYKQEDRDMSKDTQTITLAPRAYGKLGVLHCGVTREGLVTVAGDVQRINDGKEAVFSKSKVTVSRKGSEYTFARK
jgi:hypothetical protein